MSGRFLGVAGVLLAGCFGLVVPAGSADLATLINTSHAGRISDLVYDSHRDRLFSGGEDGTVKVWNPSNGRLLRSLRPTHRSIQKIIIHPRESRVAVVAGDPLTKFSLSVWDWEQGKRLFSLDTREQPLYLRYSPSGTYLIYSKADYRSLTVLNPDTGSRLGYLRRGFGIVSYFAISRNEKNIMTYQASGVISYWEIKTGKNLKQVKTLSNLRAIQISPNNRFIAAVADDRLVIVDLLTGSVVDQVECPGISRLAFSLQGNAVTAILKSEERTLLKRWYFNGKILSELPVTNTGGTSQLSGWVESRWMSLTYGGNNLFLGDQQGRIFLLNPGGEYHLISQNVLLPISDLAFSGPVMAVASPRWIAFYDSDFFAGTSPAAELAAPKQTRLVNPFSAIIGLEFLDEQRLILWRKNDDPGIIAIVHRVLGSTGPKYSDFASPLVQLKVRNKDIITVEKSGLCRILDGQTFTTLFEYLSPGTNVLIPTGDDQLLAGKSSDTTFGSPLLRINRITGETVSIVDSGLFIYDLLYDERTRQVYSLGVQRGVKRGTTGDSVTLFKARSRADYEREQILYRYQGEDLSAALAVNDRGWVYTSLGYGVVHRWSGSRLLPMEATDRIPRKLYATKGKLFALNRDSSITVWDQNSRRIIMDIFIFRDLSWAAITQDGSIYSSPKGKDYLTQAAP